MSNPLDTEVGSELFSNYEAELKLVEADLNQKLDQIPEMSGEERKAAIRSAERAVDEARELLEQMNLEKSNIPSSTRAKVNARFRNHQSDIDTLSRKLKTLSSDRSALFGNRYTDDPEDASKDVQLEQRQQLLSGTDRLGRSGERLRESQRIALETEQIGAGTLADLHQQRNVIENTHRNLQQSEGYVDRSVKTLRGMARRMATNRLITIAIITVLVLLIIGIIYSKFKTALFNAPYLSTQLARVFAFGPMPRDLHIAWRLEAALLATQIFAPTKPLRTSLAHLNEMVLHNPNNWHWVNKDAAPWAKDYLTEKVTQCSTEENGVTAKISKLTSMDGDVDVSQRKGKVITIFDVKLNLQYEGKTKDGEDVSGSISVPEVAHDTEPDEYVFEVDIYSETKEKAPVKELVRAKLVPQLREAFSTLGPALIKEHGKDIQHQSGSNPSSGFSTPTWHPQKERQPTKTTSANTQTTGTSSVNTTTVTANDEFRTTAEEMFQTFTDPQRLAAFTRAPPRIFEGAKPGAKFAIFDGNVSGEFVTLDKPTKIVQKWRLAQWPEGHTSNQEIVFDQNEIDHVTNMRVTWTGVPVGQEEVVQRNWEGYYVRAIKQTFGFGTIL